MAANSNDLMNKMSNGLNEGLNKFGDAVANSGSKLLEAGKSMAEDMLSTPSSTSSMVRMSFSGLFFPEKKSNRRTGDAYLIRLKTEVTSVANTVAIFIRLHTIIAFRISLFRPSVLR